MPAHPPATASSPPPIYNLVGLPLLYASAYFLPLLAPMGAYLLPSRDLFRWIVAPTMVVMIVGPAVLYATWIGTRNWRHSQVYLAIAVVASSILGLIALKGVLEAAGYHWQDRIPRGHDLVATQQYVRMVVAAAILAAFWFVRHKLFQVTRLLSSFGLAFGVVALFRILILSNALSVRSADQPPAFPAAESIRLHSAAAMFRPTPLATPRRVVWVIFDETDLQRVYGNGERAHPAFENFERLKSISVFAANANSPASATLYSIPALLTGIPINGASFDPEARLMLQQPVGSDISFDQSTSIFGALKELGLSSSVLGFFHPYCKIFNLNQCTTFVWPMAGGLSDALWSNVPATIASVFGRVDGWEHITRETERLLPQYLSRDDALTFIHINVPHLPALYADHELRAASSPDPLVEYSRNLALADRMLGVIVHTMQERSEGHDLLLIVSSDHWLRNRWYQPNSAEVSRPIPLIMWRVGETQGTVLSQPLSTIHTAAMILDWLTGAISSQGDIAGWWGRQPVNPPFIAPST